MRKRYAVDDEERRTISICVKLKPSHYDKLEKLIKRDEITRTWIMEKALLHYFKHRGV